MSSALRTSIPSKTWELLPPFALILWRIASHPAATLWRDWVVLLCFYWIYTALRHRGKEWPAVTAASMVGLLVLYATSQVPLALAALDFRP